MLKPQRMKIVEHGPSGCTIHYNDPFAGYIARSFVASARGGWVCEIGTGSKEWPVCDGLARLGNMIYWHPESGRISRLIRKHYKLLRRGLAKDAA